LKKVFKNSFLILKNQLHKQGPTRRANLFTSVFGKLRTSFDYNKRDRTRNLTTCYANVLIGKKVFDRKKCREMHSGYIESRTSFEGKKRHCLSTLIKLQDKDKGKSLNA